MLSENLSSKSLLIKVFLEFVSSVENHLLGQKWLSGGVKVLNSESDGSITIGIHLGKQIGRATWRERVCTDV